jgi:hypothetical protein
MPKEKKPGWQYFFSEYLNEEFALHEETGWVYFEKGARYSPAEFDLMNKHGSQIDLATHKVKTIIGGELVDIKPIPKPPEPMTRPGELEIW